MCFSKVWCVRKHTRVFAHCNTGVAVLLRRLGSSDHLPCVSEKTDQAALTQLASKRRSVLFACSQLGSVPDFSELANYPVTCLRLTP